MDGGQDPLITTERAPKAENSQGTALLYIHSQESAGALDVSSLLSPEGGAGEPWPDEMREVKPLTAIILPLSFDI